MEGTVNICPQCCEKIETCFSLTFVDQEEKDAFLEHPSYLVQWFVSAYEDSAVPYTLELQPSEVTPYIDGLNLSLCIDLPAELADNVYSCDVVFNGKSGDVTTVYFTEDDIEFYIACNSKDKATELFNEGLKPSKKGCCKSSDAKKKAMEAWLALEAMEASFCCGNYEGVQVNIELINSL